MTAPDISPAPSIHASCVLVGARAVLIRGASGAGKSRLALRLLQAGERRLIPFARLVSDDRTLVEARHGRLLARPVPQLAGMIEVRGVGIQKMPFEAFAVVGLVVDLATAAERLPSADQQVAEVAGVCLPRLAVPADCDPLPILLAEMRRAAA
jgi:HPr kinase/phosphorylase